MSAAKRWISAVAPSAAIRPACAFPSAMVAPASDDAIAAGWFPLVHTGSGSSRGPNKLPPKYSIPEQSPLKVAVNPEGTDLQTREVTK